MKILFLPLFKMPNGHHKVADALIDIIQKRTNKVTCEKIDLLSYCSEKMEKAVSKAYLKWIDQTPQSYDWVYNHFAYTKSHRHCSFKGLEFYFLNRLTKLLEEVRPDTVVCTQGFPSLLMSRLKLNGVVRIPVINVYTDFFINDIWGREGIDYHLVPNLDVKRRMIEEYGLKERNIIVTGIPIHETFLAPRRRTEPNDVKTVLVAGGSSGLGDIHGLLEQLQRSDRDHGFHYIVLCGKNERLFNDLKAKGHPRIEPLPYISSREKMNELYDRADAIITKPGGVTVSEALRKRLLIFIHSALPGQEYINLQYLKEKHLVYEIRRDADIESQLARVLNDDLERRKWEREVDRYFSEMQMHSTRSLYNFLMANVAEGVYINSMTDAITKKRGFVSKIKKYAKKMSMTSNLY